jgi:hypothetical protein
MLMVASNSGLRQLCTAVHVQHDCALLDAVPAASLLVCVSPLAVVRCHVASLLHHIAHGGL